MIAEEARRGAVGGIAFRIIPRRGTVRLVSKQQYLVKRQGNILEHAAEGHDKQNVPVVRRVRRAGGGPAPADARATALEPRPGDRPSGPQAATAGNQQTQLGRC